jgi:hypothetical protein
MFLYMIVSNYSVVVGIHVCVCVCVCVCVYIYVYIYIYMMTHLCVNQSPHNKWNIFIFNLWHIC